jgi:hypothetical protein
LLDLKDMGVSKGVEDFGDVAFANTCEGAKDFLPGDEGGGSANGKREV